MPFELKKDEPIAKGIRRIICDRIDDALDQMHAKSGAFNDMAVHETRKRFKEIRGALRLVRDELGEKIFQREKRAFRNAGRPLSELRDAKVMIDALNQLVTHFRSRTKSKYVAELKTILAEHLAEIRKRILRQDQASAIITRQIRATKKRVHKWPLQKDGWKAVECGIQKVYTKGRCAMREAQSNPTDEILHEWRKRSKDLRYELELLRTICRKTVKQLTEQAHQLTDLLGDDHDLAMLKQFARKASNGQHSVDNQLLSALVDKRRSALQKSAQSLGENLYRESPRDFVARLSGYWKCSR